MSLPTFDVGIGESGGRPQVFGGAEIFRYLNRKNIQLATIVVTQFERFGKGDTEKDIDTLRSELKVSFGSNFAGLVYYDTTGDWKESLNNLLNLKVV